jgi:hypothetical protein
MGHVREFILVTHTRWDEAPRIRHQLARLLAGNGHRVLFVERADGPLAQVKDGAREVEPGIFLTRTNRLLHHQLRVVAPLDRANEAIVLPHLIRQVKASGFAPDATVINFTHDYCFLRKAFPSSEVITIINDDFEAQARFRGFGHVTRTLRETCRSSDRVLALSTVLRDRLQEWVPAELFYPWAIVPYVPPAGDVDTRDTLLFWGYIDIGIDTAAVRRISERLAATNPRMRIMMVGPTQVPARRRKTTMHLDGLSNVTVHEATPLDRLPMDRMLAAFIPYQRKGDADAVELPNKMLQLLAYGLPIVKTGMPNAVKAEFIMSVESDPALDAAINDCFRNFSRWQPAIRSFLAQHTAEARLAALRVEHGR